MLLLFPISQGMPPTFIKKLLEIIPHIPRLSYFKFVGQYLSLKIFFFENPFLLYNCDYPPLWKSVFFCSARISSPSFEINFRRSPPPELVKRLHPPEYSPMQSPIQIFLGHNPFSYKTNSKGTNLSNHERNFFESPWTPFPSLIWPCFFTLTTPKPFLPKLHQEGHWSAFFPFWHRSCNNSIWSSTLSIPIAQGSDAFPSFRQDFTHNCKLVKTLLNKLFDAFSLIHWFKSTLPVFLCFNFWEGG